jgi:hypothetical protein
MDLYAVNCRLNKIEGESTTLAIPQSTCVLVEPKLKGPKAFGYN